MHDLHRILAISCEALALRNIKWKRRGMTDRKRNASQEIAYLELMNELDDMER